MPLIASFSIWDMVASSLRALRWLCLNYGFSQLAARRRRLAAWYRRWSSATLSVQRCAGQLAKRVASGAARDADQDAPQTYPASIHATLAYFSDYCSFHNHIYPITHASHHAIDAQQLTSRLR